LATPKIRVTTHLENLEKSGNCELVRENGEKSGKTIISFSMPPSANTLNNEMKF